MIEQSRIEKILRRTIIQLLAVMAVGVGILIYLLVVRLQGSSGPPFWELGLVLVAMLAWGGLLYLAGLGVKGIIGRKYGQK